MRTRFMVVRMLKATVIAGLVLAPAMMAAQAPA